jgi:hypothetical protein
MPAETVAAVVPSEDIHAWEAGGAASAEALSGWVSARLAAHESAWPPCWLLKGRAPRRTRCGCLTRRSSSSAWPGRRRGF